MNIYRIKIKRFMSDILGFCFLSSLVFYGCQPAPAVFHGKLYVRFEDKLIAISCTDKSSPVDLKIIENGVSQAAASTDGKLLVFSQNHKTFLMESSNGTKKEILDFSIKEIKWTLDNTAISFKKYIPGEDELKKRDTIFIYSVPDQKYKTLLIAGENSYTRQFPGKRDKGPTFNLTGGIENIYWLAADKFIFQRGSLDYLLNVNSFETQRGKFKPNKTSLAFVSDKVRIIDSQTRWWVKGVNRDASYLLMSKSELKSDSLYVVPNFSSFESIAARSIYCRPYEYVNFLAGTTKLYFAEDGTNEITINLINPQSLELENEFTLKYTGYFKDAFLMNEKYNLLAYRQYSSVAIYDVINGGYLRIQNDAMQTPMGRDDFELLCWIY